MQSAQNHSDSIAPKKTRSQTLKQQLSTLNVEHNADGLEFFIRIGTTKAFLSYWHDKHNVVVMEHTEVPAEYGGQGIGKHLAKVSLFGGRIHTG